MLTALLALAACSPSSDGFRAGPAPARAAADDLFGSLALRFSSPTRTPKATAARRKFGRHTFTPSLIYNDTSATKLAVSVHTFGSQTVTAGTFTLTMPANDASNALLRVA